MYNIYIYTYIYIYIYIYTHVYIYIHMYIYIYTIHNLIQKTSQFCCFCQLRLGKFSAMVRTEVPVEDTTEDLGTPQAGDDSKDRGIPQD